MSSIGILLTSRNNYDFMEKFWIPNTVGKCDINCKILNIDEDSTEEEKQKGKILCDRYNINYIDREERGMHHNIDTAIRFFGDSVKYIIWFQHDCWPLQEDFFVRFNNLVKDNRLDIFGTIGFNAIAQNMFKHGDMHKNVMKDFEEGRKPLGVLSRAFLESVLVGDIHYCGYKVKNRIKKPVSRNLYAEPFACEVPIWYAIAINTDLFKIHIDKNRPFYFFKSWDDISFQFLVKNIYNLVLPDFYIEHRPDLKKTMGIPYLSTNLVKKGNYTYHSNSGSTPEQWKKVWGWDMENPSTFERVKHKYKKTLKLKFYKYDFTKGPLKIFNIKEKNNEQMV